MVPLLSNAPLAQKEFVRTSRGVTVLLSRFQRAPQAEWLLICSGSSDARSKKRTKVGETTIASNATMPEVSFLRLNVHAGASDADGAASEDEIEARMRDSSDHFMLKEVFFRLQLRPLANVTKHFIWFSN